MNRRTTTDADGRFRLTGMPGGKGTKLVVFPAEDQPYFIQAVEDPAAPGDASVEVALTRGIWIEGKVTEQATGQPVADVDLIYSPARDNEFARNNPIFRPTAVVNGPAMLNPPHNRADGSYRLVGLPGRGIVGAQGGLRYLSGVGADAIGGRDAAGRFADYNPRFSKRTPTAMQEINPPADATVVAVNFEFRTGASVRLRFADSAGRPVSGVTVQGAELIGMPTAELVAQNLAPDEARQMLIVHPERKIGKVATIRAGDDASGPVVVTLEPLATLTGRVLDPDGNPVPLAEARPSVVATESHFLSFKRGVTTDEEGRFAIADVAVGCDYVVSVVAVGSAAKDFRLVSFAKTTVRPGATTDLGEVRFKQPQ